MSREGVRIGDLNKLLEWLHSLNGTVYVHDISNKITLGTFDLPTDEEVRDIEEAFYTRLRRYKEREDAIYKLLHEGKFYFENDKYYKQKKANQLGDKYKALEAIEPLFRQLVAQCTETLAQVEETRQFYKDAMQDQAQEYFASLQEQQAQVERLNKRILQTDHDYATDITEYAGKLNQALDALDKFVGNHFAGGSKADRPDYSVMVPCADIYELSEALQSIKGVDQDASD